MNQPTANRFYSVDDTYAPRNSIGFLMRSVIASNKAERDRRLAGHGFTDAHWVPIFKLHREGACSLATLTAELGLDPQAMLDTLAQLQARGVVTSSGDGDAALYQLSAQGVELGGVVQQVLVDIANHNLRGFSQPEFSTLLALLQKMHENTLTASTA